MNLKEWAGVRGISYQTALRWYHRGLMPVPVRRVGRLVLVDCDEHGLPFEGSTFEPTKTIIYARVSSADQKSDLDRQIARVMTWASAKELSVDGVVTEIGSSLDGHRKKFEKLLRDGSVRTILVEHRDRFCRFGSEYIEAALSAQNRRLLVVDDKEIEDDLVQDMTDVLTSMCARLYGKRSAKHRARKAVENVMTTDGEESVTDDHT